MEMLELKPKQTKTIKKVTDEIFFQWAHKEV